MSYRVYFYHNQKPLNIHFIQLGMAYQAAGTTWLEADDASIFVLTDTLAPGVLYDYWEVPPISIWLELLNDL